MNDALRHLDKRFKELSPLAASPRPMKGWVRALRDALGMTSGQLARRMGVKQPRITELEKAEMTGGVTISTMERAAESLGCRFVYALIPDQSLTQKIKDRARLVARRHLARTQQTMTLENQCVNDPDVEEEMIDGLILELMKKPSRLWDDE